MPEVDKFWNFFSFFISKCSFAFTLLYIL